MARDEKPRDAPDHDLHLPGVDADRGEVVCIDADDEQPVKKVTSLRTGAATGRYFRKRNYE